MTNNTSATGFVVYIHTAPNGKSYIGQTNNYRRRLSYHNRGKSGCPAFNSAVKKYGWDNFKSVIVLDNLTLEEANELEEHLIKSMNTQVPNGYNIHPGGLNHTPTPELIEKRVSTRKKNAKSSWNKGIPMTEQKKKQMDRSGKAPWNKGKNLTEEHKQALRNAYARRRGEING